MFLTQKQTPFSFTPNPSSPYTTPKPFDQALILRLSVLRRSLAKSTRSLTLSSLVDAVDLLSVTLSSFSLLLSDPNLSRSAADIAALSSHLDASVTLLDAANSLTADVDRLSRLRLHLAFALHLLARKPLTSDLKRKARASIAEWQENLPRTATTVSAAVLVGGETPRGTMSAVQRAICAVEAVSALVVGIVSSFLGARADLEKIRVSSEFCWSEEFNGVLTAVNGKIGGFAAEIEAVDTDVKDLTVVIDDDEKLRSVTEVMEKRTVELTEGLERLGNAINVMFRAALSSRDVALLGFRIGSRKCR